MVRRAERTLRDEPRARRSRPATEWIAVTSSASSNVSGGRIPARRLRHHRLAGARRADQQHVVAAGRGNFERAARERLAADVGEVAVGRRGLDGVAPAGLRPATPGAHAGRSARDTASDQRARPENSQPFDHGRLAAVGVGSSRPDTAGGAPPPRSAARRAPAGCRRRATARPAAARRRRRAASMTPAAASTPSAIGRSKDAPALRMSAGARFTVTRCGGNSKPEFRIALRTRSRLSRTLASGSPTIVKRRKAERDVDLDLDGAGVDPEDGGGAHAGEHRLGDASGRAVVSGRKREDGPRSTSWLTCHDGEVRRFCDRSSVSLSCRRRSSGAYPA